LSITLREGSLLTRDNARLPGSRPGRHRSRQAAPRGGLAARQPSHFEVAKGRDHYLYYNGHGDLAAEADASGARTALHTYTPFGAPNDAPPANSTVHRYTGRWDKQYDTTSSLVLMGARPYDPSLGRFLAVDPIDGGSLNNYDYAAQDPVNGYDLSGQMFDGDPDVAAGNCDSQSASCENNWDQEPDPHATGGERAKRGWDWAKKHPGEVFSTTLLGTQAACAIGGILTGGAGWVTCELYVGAASVVVAVHDRKHAQGANSAGGIACVAAGAASDGMVALANRACSVLATALDAAYTYYGGRH
jgi:RHS repeat-associated protein